MADTLILEGTTTLEVSAKGAGADVRNWAKGQVGRQGGRLFLNNIAEPGNVDTIINLHRGNVGIGTDGPPVKLTVDGPGPGPIVAVRNAHEFSGGITVECFGERTGVGVFSNVAVGTGVHGVCQGVGTGVKAQARAGVALNAVTERGNVIEGRRRDPVQGVDELVFVVRRNGTVLADGPFGGPADFAEMLRAAGPRASYEPGDVLVIGPDGLITHSQAANATNLAGVHSADPGFVGDMRIRERGLEASEEQDPSTDDETWLAVALVGVVPVKVTAENGAIAPGDLLTSSNTPGHAMRATPVRVGGVDIYPTGAMLGKALEPLAAGQGRIKVLLTVR
jgi:hypothetical protein